MFAPVKISIVLPTYNGEEYIKKSIDSVINQTYKNWELIIVNDCSTDNTASIIEEYSKKDKRIKIITNKENKKLPASLNIGFENTKGEYLTWTSDDNEYYPLAFETMLNFLENNPDYGMVYAQTAVEKNGRMLNCVWSDMQATPSKLLEICTPGACFLYRKDIADKVGKYDEMMFLNEDHDFWLRMRLETKIANINKTLYLYRLHSKGLTLTRKKEVKKGRIVLLRKYRKIYSQKFQEINETYKDELLFDSFIADEIDFNTIKTKIKAKKLYKMLNTECRYFNDERCLRAVFKLGGTYILKGIFLFIINKILNKRKRVLIISNSFAGGGLETRVNLIVQKFYGDYDFSLITKTPKDDMRVKPSFLFRRIYQWEDMEEAIKKADILDIHPFWANDAFNIKKASKAKRIFYTIHGESSVEDGFEEFFAFVDRIFVVSKLLKEKLVIKYPKIKDKITLYRNCYKIRKMAAGKEVSRTKDVLVSITRFCEWEYLENVFNVMSDYKIHIIGYLNEEFDLTRYKNVVYDGFVNVEEYLDNNSFALAFSRGGYAAMDLISRNIPVCLIYNRGKKAYLEMLNRDNFKELSDCNFVSWKEYDEQYFKNELKQIDLHSNFYRCRDMFVDINGTETMTDPYKVSM